MNTPQPNLRPFVAAHALRPDFKSIALLCFLLPGLAGIRAAEIRKAPNGDPLDQGSSWIGGIAPTNTDVAVWDADSSPPTSPLTDLHWQGLRLLETPTLGTLAIYGGPYTLTLGDAGIDMSAADANLELYFPFLSLDANQVWNIGPGRVVTVFPENGPGTGALYKTGPGTLKFYFSTAASHLNDAAPLGLAGGTVQLEGNAHAEVVASTLVYGDASRVMQTSFGTTLVLNNITRSVGGTVDFATPGVASTSTPNDSSENGGILGGWATVSGHLWAQAAAGGGNQPINDFPTFYSVDFLPDRNVNLPFTPGGYTLTNTTGVAINSLRFDGDQTLTIGTSGAYSLTNLTGGILMGGGALQAAIVSTSTARTLRGPPGGDLIFHVPFLPQVLSNQARIFDNGGSGLTKSGEGTLMLNPNLDNLYAGLTTINAGTLRTGGMNNRRYVSGSLLINPNGTYLHGNGENNLNFTAITVNGGRLNLNSREDACPALSLVNNGTITGYDPGEIFTVGTAGTPLDARWGTIDVQLAAPNGLVKTTDRTVRLTQNGTISGTTRVENGSLLVANDALVSAGTLVLGTPTNNARIVLGGTNAFGDSGGSLTVTNLLVQGTNVMPGFGFIVGSCSTPGTLMLDFAHDTDFNMSLLGGPGPFENQINLRKTGVGVLTLTNHAFFAGIIENSVGTLKIGDTNSIPSGPAKGIISLTSGTLDLNGLDVSVGGLGGAGTVNSSVGATATLRLRNNGYFVFDGSVVNGNSVVSVVQSGTGEQVFRGNNTYFGSTTIHTGGTIGVDADAILGNGTSGIILSGGTLDIAESRAPGSPISNPIQPQGFGFITTTASGSVSADFSGNLITGGNLVFDIRANNTQFNPRLTGGFTFASGISIQHASFPNLGVTTLHSANSTGTTQIFNGVISGPGIFQRSTPTVGAAGLTILNATNTHFATFVNDGVLRVNGAMQGFPGDPGYVVVQGQGTLTGNGRIAQPLTVGGGGTLSPGTSIGTMTVSNSLTFQTGGICFMELKQEAPQTNDFVRGITTVTYGGTLSVTNLAGTLAAGDSFRLFSASNYVGAFTNIVPSSPGPGLVWDISSLTTNGTLKIASAPTGPQIGSVVLSGTNLVIGGSGGTTNGTYYVLTATNITVPLGNWDFLATNNFDGAGHFIFTNGFSPGTPQRFFLLKLP